MDITKTLQLRCLLAARMRVACLVAVAVPPICLSAPVVVHPSSDIASQCSLRSGDIPAPMPEYADTEVSTNLAVSVDGELPQDLEMTFALYGECVSNCLQVVRGLLEAFAIYDTLCEILP